MVSGVASTLPNLAAKPKRRGQSLVELPLISPSIADRLARRAPNSYMLSGKQMEEAMGMSIIRHKVKDYRKWRPMFDKHAGMQKQAGLSNPRVFRSAAQPSALCCKRCTPSAWGQELTTCAAPDWSASCQRQTRSRNPTSLTRDVPHGRSKHCDFSHVAVSTLTRRFDS